MRVIIVGSIIAFTLMGCETNGTLNKKTVNVDLNYAATSLGYRNSGLLDAGSLFIWDVVDNELTLLSEDVVLEERSRTAATSQEAKNLTGLDLSAKGGIPSTVSIDLKADIKRNYVYLVSNAVRTKSKHIYTSITKEYTRLKQDGVDAVSVWRLNDLDANPDRYKLVLARSPVYADSETLTFDRGSNASATIKAKGLDDTTFEIKAPKEVSGKCSGKQALCYINISVLEASLVSKQDADGNTVQNLDYSPATGYDRTRLPEALRKLN